MTNETSPCLSPGIEVPVLLSLFFYILLEVKGDSLTLSLAFIEEYVAGFHTVCRPLVLLLMVKIYKYKRMNIQYYNEMRDENDYRTRKA